MAGIVQKASPTLGPRSDPTEIRLCMFQVGVAIHMSNARVQTSQHVLTQLHMRMCLSSVLVTASPLQYLRSKLHEVVAPDNRRGQS